MGYYWRVRQRLGFSLAFLGVLNVAGHASYVIGSWVYRDYLRLMPFRSMLKRTIWAAFVVGISTLLLVQRWNLVLHVPDWAFVLGDTAFVAACSQIAFMPIAVLAAKVAPKGAEGTIYNSVISVFNLGSVVSEFTGGLLTKALGVREGDFDNLWALIVICNLTTLLPVPLLSMLPDIGNAKDGASDDEASLSDVSVGGAGMEPSKRDNVTEMTPLFEK